ncbi:MULTISPECIES: Gfo/Idh/MocA family oxidoreductase [unclassified Mesobacillus]|jgi:predicted dehydrogenase|uniref:Gfo/Idh/MocA family protein n=1 Tax=unclassified Mesobacillus TaxID=2675270 RepID=UPI00203BBB62|nr:MULTISPECIES: Gfo/Idh/MocA family oxidoreductase [unclassified Mesobacillus]MCM3123832.1 Gfo/Idh/MocA family oxidoreductase [Mesobacillus sp. MER 33]MCM3234153.1 Gfo/Idh/MocA family oxidoreductase [Mesobacillus sp. MER 48]
MKPLTIGMIGLDTSHCLEFTKLLNDPDHPFHVKGGQVAYAYPFYSEDLEISKDRVKGYTETLRNEFAVKIIYSIEEVARMSDAILLTAVDGRKHPELFKQLLPYKVPVFIDKPLALSLREAKEIYSLAESHDVPVMSSSSLRYAESFRTLIDQHKEEITGIYVHGPLPQQPLMPGYFWYGIHMIEMVVAAMGLGTKEVWVKKSCDHETVMVEWTDGRHAVVRGEYEWHSRFGVTIHTSSGFYNADISKDAKPFYASLLEQAIHFFQTKKSPVLKEETLEVIRVIEMINK